MLLGARQSLLGQFSSNWPYTDGTNIEVKFNTDNYSFSLGNLVKASGSSTITIDWGDGTKDISTNSSFSITHTYSKAGNYLLYISDDMSSFRYDTQSSKGTLYGIYSFGTKLMTIQSVCFQNSAYRLTTETEQEYVKWYKDKYKDNIVDLWCSSVSSYGLEGIRCKNLRFRNMTSIDGVYFYAGGLTTVQNLYFDKCNSIPGDYLHGWSNFMNGWNNYFDFKSITFLNKTCAQIKAMSSFPWRATASDVTIPIWFIGTDGVMDKNGNIQQGMTSPVPQIIL